MNESIGLVAVVCASLSLAACAGASVESEASTAEEIFGNSASVFVMSNASDKNELLAYRARNNGRLDLLGAFPTGGFGSGGGLGSQGAVIADGEWVFAVNAGSHEISSFEVRGRDLVLRDIVHSGGLRPISLTIHHDLLYVLNAGEDGGPGNITGFFVDAGKLTEIPGSTKGLSEYATGVGPAQVGFSPNGDFLVVTEKATNKLTSYVVHLDGTPSEPLVTDSAGQTPFGFAFGRDGSLYVSEAFGGAPDASTVSSYAIGQGAAPSVINASVPTGQTAACWVVLSADGRYAYTTNTGSNTLSGYDIGRGGELVRFDDGGATASTGDGPIDVAVSSHGRLMYVLNARDDSVSVLRVRNDGRLRNLTTLTGLPASAVGIAVR